MKTMTLMTRMMPMSPDLKKELTKELPASGPEAPVVRRTIGKTTYLVKVHFNPDSKETLQDKLERMLVNEVNNPDPAA
jgi:hypothetical protein